MAIDKLPERDDPVPIPEHGHTEPESDSEYDDDDIPDLEEFSGGEQDDRTTGTIQ